MATKRTKLEGKIVHRNDATCFLREGYEVIGGNGGSKRGRVTSNTELTARIRWEDGETETVDQFEHGYQVIDSRGNDARGQRSAHW